MVLDWRKIQRKDHVFHRLKEQTASQSDLVPLWYCRHKSRSCIHLWGNCLVTWMCVVFGWGTLCHFWGLMSIILELQQMTMQLALAVITFCEADADCNVRRMAHIFYWSTQGRPNEFEINLVEMLLCKQVSYWKRCTSLIFPMGFAPLLGGLEEWFPIFQFLKIIALERYLSVFENEYSHASYQV